ncbi:MAG: hypothetical protein HYX34_00620 [Actinobacteria bacterium]|nr:hypothetical protein [Actinomycetota bacterium]
MTMPTGLRVRRLAPRVVAAIILLGATLALGELTGLPASSADRTANFVATGHDMEYHCALGQQCPYFSILVTKVRNGSTLPVLAIAQAGDLPAALTAVSVPFTPVDPTDPAFATTPFVSPSGAPLFSAIVVNSDDTCGGCDGTAAGITAINARKDDFKAFFNAGGGIFALAGAERRDTYYDFVPLSGLAAAAVSPPFTVTAEGTALGITDAEANCCPTHNAFANPPDPFVVLESDSAGLAETIAAFDVVIGGGGFETTTTTTTTTTAPTTTTSTAPTTTTATSVAPSTTTPPPPPPPAPPAVPVGGAADFTG